MDNRVKEYCEYNEIIQTMHEMVRDGDMTQAEYDVAAKAIGAVNAKTAEQIFREVDHEYMLEDAHAQVKEYFDGRDICRQDRHYNMDTLPINYEHLVSEFENRQDCEIAENDLWQNIIADHVKELIQAAEAEYDKSFAVINKAREMASQGHITGPARDMLIDEQLEQQSRLDAANEAMRKGNIRAYAMVRRAYFYVEANKPQEKEYDAGYFKGSLEAFKSLETILSQGIEGDKLKDVIMKNIDDFYAQSLTARNPYEGGFALGSFGAWNSALVTLNGQVGYTIIAGLDDASVVEPLIKDVSSLLGRNVEYRLRETKSDTDNYPNLVIYVTREEEDRVIASDIAMSYLYPGIGH